MRQPGSIQLDLGSVEDGSPRPGKRQPDHRAEPDWRIVREVVEDEIAQAIDDGVVLVPLDALGDVWMCTDDGVRASVDQPMRQSLLLRRFYGLELFTPMQEQEHDVGVCARVLDVQSNVLFDEPRAAGGRRSSGESARRKIIVAKKSDALALGGENDRLVGGALVGSAAKVGQLGFIQELELGRKALLAPVAGMVVGQRNGREVFFEQR